jgi:hypothetical protein
MTLFVQHRPERPHELTVSCTHGPVELHVTEEPGHLRHFWGQLGHELAKAEGKTPGQRAYERYREHSQGKSQVTGESLPVWEDTEQHIRDTWEHSVSA